MPLPSCAEQREGGEQEGRRRGRCQAVQSRGKRERKRKKGGEAAAKLARPPEDLDDDFEHCDDDLGHLVGHALADEGILWSVKLQEARQHPLSSSE